MRLFSARIGLIPTTRPTTERSLARALRSASLPTRDTLSTGQEFVWFLLVMLVPLSVNLWGNQPFELPKAILVRTLIWILAALALARILPTVRQRALHASPLLGPLTLLAAVIVVTTATAPDWRLSLWGSYERSQGAVTLLSYLLLCVLAATQLGTPERARRVTSAMAAASVPVVLISVAQALGWQPLDLIDNARSPIYATLGRANFVGAYLALLTPLTLAMLLTASQPRRRMLWSLALAAQLLVVALSLSRGAWLATGVALASFCVLWWWPRLARRWRWPALTAVCVLSLSGPLAVLAWGPRAQGSIGARFAIWQASLRLIAERPLLGYGADGLGLVFGRVYPPQLVYLQGREAYVDRAHSLLLDWTLIAGLPGLLAFLLVLLTFLSVAGRALVRGQTSPSDEATLEDEMTVGRRALLAAAVAAVVGNVAGTLVSFDVVPTATAMWLLMGMGVALAAPKIPADRRAVTPRRVSLVLLVLLPALGVAVWHANARPILADHAALAAARHLAAGESDEGAADAQRAVDYWPVEPSHQRLLGAAHAQAGFTSAPPRLAQAERALAEARRLRPDDVENWLRTASFYAASIPLFGRAASDSAKNAYRTALTLSPNDARIYTGLGALYMAEDDPVRAAEVLRRAVALDATNGDAYILLGAAELALGRWEIALADYAEALRLMPDSAEAYAGMAECYRLLDLPRRAMRAAEIAWRLAQNKP